MHPRVDPKDPQHLYIGTGVRSSAMGFWVSNDGGNSWRLPPGFETWAASSGSYDTYDIAVDPTDFNHVLVSFHSPWRNSPDSGVAESKDGGSTWVGHVIKGSGYGNSASFLFNTALGIGNSSTWLVGTQGSGFWRTTDAGTTWNKVTTNVMTHGGNQIYYTSSGVLYSGGSPKMMRSMDNGLSWTTFGVDGPYTSVFGDGSHLYSARYYGPAPFLSTSESDGSDLGTLRRRRAKVRDGAVRAGLRRGKRDTLLVDMAVESPGAESKVPLIFLHGVMRRRQTFLPLYAGLGSHWHLDGLDFPGHGDSHRTPGHYQVIDYVSATVALLRVRKEPFILYGHSLGAMVATGVAAALPAMVRAIVLENPPFNIHGIEDRKNRLVRLLLLVPSSRATRLFLVSNHRRAGEAAGRNRGS